MGKSFSFLLYYNRHFVKNVQHPLGLTYMIGKLNLLLFVCVVLLFLCLFSCNQSSVASDGDNEPTGFIPKMISNTQEIHSFLKAGSGQENAKLVFVKKIIENKETYYNLYYIDFSENTDTPAVHCIKAARGAQVPVISPDGEWVVFARSESMAEAGAPPANKSSTYICRIDEDASPVLLVSDSAFEPRFMQNSSKLTVIFPTRAENYAWTGKGRTMKIEIDVSGSVPKRGKIQILFETAGFTGGLSFDNKYLCGGGGNVGMVDITSDDTRGDTASAFGQACNASISSSITRSNALMYLTTTGQHPLVNGGKSWGMWQAILIGTGDKDVLKGFMYPTTYKIPLETSTSTIRNAKWHHCEWSNHPYFAIATLNIRRTYGGTDATEYQEMLYIVNLKDSTYLEILRPETVEFSGIPEDNSGYYWPWLWVEKVSGFTEETGWLKP